MDEPSTGPASQPAQGSQASSTPSKKRDSITKLARLPKNYRVEKRPLARPPLASKYSTSAKRVYISTKTPFMSAVKRVQRLLAQVETRQTQSAAATIKTKSSASKESEITQVATRLAADRVRMANLAVSREVSLQGTGKAIEKTLGLALWFGQREGYRIAVRTGSVCAIDDLVLRSDLELEAPPAQGESMDVDDPKPEAAAPKSGRDEKEEEIPEARVRQVSYVEVSVALK